jgi:phosphoribosylcarboxyaminoimidazole (NCAIR) mutase
MSNPTVGVLIGSKSDGETVKRCAQTLQDLGIPIAFNR